MQRKNKVMLIGSVGAGKSTLTNTLLGKQTKAVKTQSLQYSDWIVDTPGEYTENPLFYKNIMATALEVSHVLYLQDATKQKTSFPPGFSLGINKLAIGVVTKSDHEAANIDEAVKLLRRAIPKGPIVISSSISNQGIEELHQLVKIYTYPEMMEWINSQSSDCIVIH